MSLIKKAILGKIPVYFVLAHGQDYSPSKQTVTSVPKNKTLILPVELGEHLTYQGAEDLVKYFANKTKLKSLLSNLPKKFTVLEHTQQFPDTTLNFHDPYFWTGVYMLPEPKLGYGLSKKYHARQDVNMTNANMISVPARKNVSTFLNQDPDEEAVYIIASCRGVKDIPANEIFATSTTMAERTSAQKRRLEETKRDVMRGAKKRPASKSSAKSNVKKQKIDPSKKRKRSPANDSQKKQKISTPSPVKAITSRIATLSI
jgi:hypothetical protein